MNLVRELNANDFSAYQKLVNKTYENIECLKNPLLVSYNNEIALICFKDILYSIASPSMSAVYSLADGIIDNIVFDDVHYQYYPNRDIPIVSKKNHVNKDLDQLFLTLPKENEPRPYFHYYQSHGSNGEELELDYDVKDFENKIDLFLKYLDNRKPDYGTLRFLKKLLIFEYLKRMTVSCSDEDGLYKESFQVGTDFYQLFNLGKNFTYVELLNLIKGHGFRTTIDPELASIFTHSNKIFNEIEKSTELYDEYVRKR